ncbi:hypothetical protein [Lysinibacillus fusiformis]
MQFTTDQIIKVISISLETLWAFGMSYYAGKILNDAGAGGKVGASA